MDDEKRPNGATQITWTNGPPLLSDFTSPDQFAPSHLRKTSISEGAAAMGAETRKRTKYSALVHTYSFSPVAVETLGVWGAEAEELLEVLGRRMAEENQERLSKFFLRERLDVAILRGNALSILGTFPDTSPPLNVSFT